MKNILEQLKKETRSILSGLGLGPGSGSVIGLDLGLKYFRAVRLTRDIKEIPLKDTLIGQIHELKDLVSRMNIDSEEKVSVNFSTDKLAIRRVSVPIMPQEEIEEALRWELKEQVQFDITKAKIGFNILGEKEEPDGSKRIDLIAIVYRERDVEEKVKELRNLSLNIQGVFPTEFALAGYITHSNIVSPQEMIGFVDIGNNKTSIGIIKNGRLSFARDVAVGGDTITEAMTGVLILDKGKTNLSKEEAEKIKCEKGIPEDIAILSMMRPVLERFSNQIKSSMEYYEHRFGDSIGKIILAGNGSRLKGLKEYLSKEIGVEILDVLPEIAEALGLALSSDVDINMLPERFKLEKRRALKKISMRMVSIVFVFLFLVSYGLLSVKSINLKRGLKIRKAHLETVKDIEVIKDKMVMFGSAINILSSRNIETGKIMKELSNIVPSSIMLDNVLVKNTEPNLKISGIILKEEQLSEFMSSLEHSSIFEKVKLVFSEKNEDYSSGALDFEIICNLTR